MLWWFLILGVSAGAVLWATIAFYLRVRRHMHPEKPAGDSPSEHGQEPGGA